MKKLFSYFILFTFCFTSLFPKNIGAEELSYTIKPSLTEDKGKYFITIEGTTNMPDEAILNITFSYLFPGNADEKYLDYKRCYVQDRHYFLQWGPFKQKPSAGQYLFKVVFDPTRQYEKVANYINEKYQDMDNISKTEILTIGNSSDEAYQEREKMLRIIKKEALNIKKHHSEIMGHLKNTLLEKLTPDEIKQSQIYYKKIIEELDGSLKVVLAKDEIGVFETVTKYKSDVEIIVLLIKSLLQKWDEILTLQLQITKDKTKEQKDKLAALVESFERLKQLTDKEIDENLKEIGIQAFDKEGILNILSRIEKTLRNIPEDNLMKENDKTFITQHVFLLSQQIPDIFYDKLHSLASQLTRLMQSTGIISKEQKEGIIKEINKIRDELESQVQ
jgi:hypothetical protein